MNTEIITILLAFMVLMQPFSALTLFLDFTKGYSNKNRRKFAWICTLSVVITIIFFTVLGNLLLKLLGISLGAFQVAGGILVFIIGLNMMNGDGNPVKPDQEEVDVEHVQEVVPSMVSAVMPMAFPMIIGPGGVSTVVIYASRANSNAELIQIILAGFLVGLICFVSLMAAHPISRFLGEEGLSIANRIMGMLLAAVAVEIFFNGLRQFMPSLFG